ncbi:helix-turn-helix domain-containing protein [Streptomyces sp. NRRL WC-3549]|uniref:helix-turn-helix domain-containing protein n=1 Tax=Streptomyces sp. NRRL WC-3549 TaxID=1463925 RepID=UPI0004CA7C5A|nr:helix-turn-helix domain-containing protein [Streptomyces sp. NRRL WC-3549]
MEDQAKEVQRVLDLIDALAEGKSPAVRARQLTELLKSIGEKVRLERRKAVLEMQAAGMTYRQIANEAGISFARVKQIIADNPDAPRQRDDSPKE